MINHTYEEIMHLKHKEKDEHFDLKRMHKWILSSMPYDDFCKFARLNFKCNRTNDPYPFSYSYVVEPKDDTPKAREDYLKYLAYKLYQNLSTKGIELQ